MKILSKSDILPEIPVDLAVCPICSEPLVIECIDEWHTDTGRVTESGLHITCSTEPSFESGDFDEWIDWHYSTPYIDWLPVKAKVYRWFDRRFRLSKEIRESEAAKLEEVQDE